MSHIDDVTRRCFDALQPVFGKQYTVFHYEADGHTAFEFWWPAFGVEGAQRLKTEQPGSSFSERFACRECARDIRAMLQAAPAPPLGEGS